MLVDTSDLRTSSKAVLYSSIIGAPARNGKETLARWVRSKTQVEQRRTT